MERLNKAVSFLQLVSNTRRSKNLGFYYFRNAFKNWEVETQTCCPERVRSM